MRHDHVAWRSPTFGPCLYSSSQRWHVFIFCEIPSTMCFCSEVTWSLSVDGSEVHVCPIGRLLLTPSLFNCLSLENCLQPKSLQKLFLSTLVYNWEQVKPRKVKQLYKGKVTQFPSKGEKVSGRSTASRLMFSGSSLCRVVGKKDVSIRCKQCSFACFPGVGIDRS